MYDSDMEELDRIGEKINDVVVNQLEQQIAAAEIDLAAKRQRLAALRSQKPRMTKEEIFAIKDTEKRQKAIAENIDLFRK